MDLGARIFTHSPAVRSARGARGWTVHSTSGSVTSDWILVATDAYSHGQWRAVGDSQIHLPYFNFATAPLAPEVRASILPNREGAWDARTVLSSFRLDAAGRLIFGSVGALEGVGRKVHEAWARRALRRIYPQLGMVGFETGWYGTIGMTPDHFPRFYRLEPHVVAFCGYNGRGIAPGTAFGRVLAGYVSGVTGDDALPLPLSQVSAPALRTMRQWIYRTGAAALHGVAARVPRPS
jgi:glycine/D-amino acid oxidase-like deaminating enzyme